MVPLPKLPRLEVAIGSVDGRYMFGSVNCMAVQVSTMAVVEPDSAHIS